MVNLSDPARNRGDLAYRVTELENLVQMLLSQRRLESASIGRGGLRLIGGDIVIDQGGNVIAVNGSVIAGDPNGERAEFTPSGYRLFDDQNQIVIDLTTAGLNQLLLRGSGDEENEILLSQTGEINGRILNVKEIVLDGENLNELLTGNNITDPDPAPGDQTEVYEAEWSQLYFGTGGRNNFNEGIAQGFFDSTNGNQRSLIGFPSGQIQSDLAGRTVTRVRVFFYFEHWFFNGGGTAVIGHHGHSNDPATFSATEDQVRSDNWPKPGGRWVQYDVGIQEWATGAKKGISIGPGPSTSHTYYGRAHDHNDSRPPRLEIRST